MPLCAVRFAEHALFGQFYYSIYFPFCKAKYKKGVLADSVALLRPRRLISLAGNTVCSNISSLVGIWIVAQMDISVYTPIGSALGIVVGVVASLIFREKLGIFSYLAAAVACAALII